MWSTAVSLPRNSSQLLILGISQISLITGDWYLGPGYKPVFINGGFCHFHLQVLVAENKVLHRISCCSPTRRNHLLQSYISFILLMFYFSYLNIKAIIFFKQVHFLGSLAFSTNPELKVEGKCYCLALHGLEVLLLAGVPHIHRFCGTGI